MILVDLFSSTETSDQTVTSSSAFNWETCRNVGLTTKHGLACKRIKSDSKAAEFIPFVVFEKAVWHFNWGYDNNLLRVSI